MASTHSQKTIPKTVTEIKAVHPAEQSHERQDVCLADASFFFHAESR
jgi:hypothetical protein